MQHVFNDFKSYYKITLYSVMFRWQPPPPSSGKLHLVSWNTAFIKKKTFADDGGGGCHRNMTENRVIL
jgi:hypothetical protein